MEELTKETYENTVVVYHDPCLDGMASRYAAWRHFGHSAKYIPGKYEDSLDVSKFDGKDVVCVDFSYKQDALMKIAEVCNSITVLDHHKTAIPEVRGAIAHLEGTPHEGKIHFEYADDLSGVGVVWDFYMPNTPMPRVLWHIQDRDLWKFSLPHTREVCCYMDSLEGNFNKWIHAVEKGNYREIVSKGTGIRQKHLREMEEIIKWCDILEWEGYTIALVTNCPKEHVSEVCHMLLDKYPYIDFSANRSWNGEGWLWSLRSTDTGRDVSAIAKSRGGGGHRNAAGFYAGKDIAFAAVHAGK